MPPSQPTPSSRASRRADPGPRTAAPISPSPIAGPVSLDPGSALRSARMTGWRVRLIPTQGGRPDGFAANRVEMYGFAVFSFPAPCVLSPKACIWTDSRFARYTGTEMRSSAKKSDDQKVVPFRKGGKSQIECKDNLEFMRSLKEGSMKLIVTSPLT